MRNLLFRGGYFLVPFLIIENTAIKTRKMKSSILKIKGRSLLLGMSRKEVLSYIQKLHKVIKKQERKIEKCRSQIKALKLSSKKKRNSKEEDLKKVSCEEEEKIQKSLIDEIKEAAEQAQNENGFIYEPTSGLYYDQKTGYYYNAEYGLYYDGNNGCYYKYDQDKNVFEFHSQVLPDKSQEDQANDELDENNKKSPKRRRRRKTKKLLIDLEDGEISCSSNDSLRISDGNDNSADERFEDIAKKYPPSLRIIVQETSLTKLKVGTLFIITFKGGTLGREGDHDVIIPDLNISKYHLKFSYDEKESVYKCVDLGSRNGTVFNGKRMSNAKQESEPADVVHGTVIQLSQTKLLCHVHNGNSTCGHCEPGLLIEQKSLTKHVQISHKEELKRLQKRYGLETEKYMEPKTNSDYSDRAALRRGQVGSTNEHEKTQVASVDTEISKDNKGFQMLSKLGWNKGEVLGKNQNGLVEPIRVEGNTGTKGLGCDAIQIPASANLKSKKWLKAQERYKTVRPTNIFDESDSSSS